MLQSQKISRSKNFQRNKTKVVEKYCKNRKHTIDLKKKKKSVAFDKNFLNPLVKHFSRIATHKHQTAERNNPIKQTTLKKSVKSSKGLLIFLLQPTINLKRFVNSFALHSMAASLHIWAILMPKAHKSKRQATKKEKKSSLHQYDNDNGFQMQALICTFFTLAWAPGLVDPLMSQK